MLACGGTHSVGGAGVNLQLHTLDRRLFWRQMAKNDKTSSNSLNLDMVLWVGTMKKYTVYKYAQYIFKFTYI